MSNNKNQKNKKKDIPEVFCPECGEPSYSNKDVFCRKCSHGLYTPKITSAWSRKVLLISFIIVAIFYILFLIFEPHLYFALDKV